MGLKKKRGGTLGGTRDENVGKKEKKTREKMFFFFKTWRNQNDKFSFNTLI